MDAFIIALDENEKFRDTVMDRFVNNDDFIRKLSDKLAHKDVVSLDKQEIDDVYSAEYWRKMSGLWHTRAQRAIHDLTHYVNKYGDDLLSNKNPYGNNTKDNLEVDFYRWHDLEKDPSDIPIPRKIGDIEYHQVLVKCKNDRYHVCVCTKHPYEDGTYFECHSVDVASLYPNGGGTPIAWREI